MEDWYDEQPIVKEDKTMLRAEIANLVDDYLERGGQIEIIQAGVSGEDWEWCTKKVSKREYIKARERGCRASSRSRKSSRHFQKNAGRVSPLDQNYRGRGGEIGGHLEV